MEYPFAGSRTMKWLLRQEGFTAGRLHVATCMKIMGIEAFYHRPNASKPAPGHKIYPDLLRKLDVCRPNQAGHMRGHVGRLRARQVNARRTRFKPATSSTASVARRKAF